MDLFENAVFFLSCGRGKTELFENVDVIASIYYVSEHAHGSLRIARGHLACLFAFIEVRTSKFACSSVFVWAGIFLKTRLLKTQIFFCTDKKDLFSEKYLDTSGRGRTVCAIQLLSSSFNIGRIC